MSKTSIGIIVRVAATILAVGMDIAYLLHPTVENGAMTFVASPAWLVLLPKQTKTSAWTAPTCLFAISLANFLLIQLLVMHRVNR